MITGGCLCGRVRYESQGAALFSVICHCRDCQRVSGSGGVPVMGVSKARFRVTGEPAQFAVEGGSRKQAIRHFCPDCGSLLFGTPEVIPDTVTLYVGSLDDPNVFKPEHSMFVRDRPCWARIDAAIPEYQTVPIE
ncbi:MAG TPA: GFA family protein [Povalibacter sp.]